MSQYFKMSHAMMLDEPIGYAHKAPPLQKKAIAQSLEKSKGLGAVIGVVAGVMTAGVGWGIAAAGGVGATLSGGAMMAGGVMSAVGAATGNKKLSKIGGVLSLAGGIGTLGVDLANGSALGTTMKEGASSAMKSVSDAWSKASGTVSATKDVGSAASQTVSLTSGAGSAGAEGVGSALTGGTEAASSTASAFGAEAGKVNLANTAAPNIQQGGILQGAFGPTTGSVSGALNTSAGSLMGIGQGGVQAGSVTNLANASGSLANAAKTGTESKGMLESAWDFAKTPDGLKMGGEVLKSVFSDDSETQAKQIGEYARQFDQKMLAEELARQRANNLGMIHYNPNDPNASKIIAAAQQAGIQAQPLTINQNANVQSPMDAMKKQGATA